jgi:hypothetical protein
MAAFLVVALIVAGTSGGVVSGRWEGEAIASSRWAWLRGIAYWFLTILVTYELAAGAVWDLLRIEYVKVVLAHLGYPQYLLLILGVWRISGALALLAPRFPRLKEWAYAGAFFDYSGAAASHSLAGDRIVAWIFPVIFCGLTLASWALRPESRRSPFATKEPPRIGAWVVPIVTVAAMLVIALFTLPSGKPPL